MTRTQRSWSVAVYVVAALLICAVFGIAGALGPVEVLIALILAVPLAIVARRLMARQRSGRSRRA